MMGFSHPDNLNHLSFEPRNYGEVQEVSTLSAPDLAAILKWSKEVSSDINLASGNIAFYNNVVYFDLTSPQRWDGLLKLQLVKPSSYTSLMKPDRL
jgi:hypothetical protein